MSTEPIDEAVVLLCGFDVGYFDYDDIVKWADRQILTSENPSNELLDLSMIQIRNTHPTDVYRLLSSLPPTESTSWIQAKLGFIGLMLMKQRITTEEAMGKLWSLIDDPQISKEQRSEIYYLDEGYDLALEKTYGKVEDVDQELRDFLAVSVQRIMDQFPQLFGV